jgi:hypothetical protein
MPNASPNRDKIIRQLAKGKPLLSSDLVMLTGLSSRQIKTAIAQTHRAGLIEPVYLSQRGKPSWRLVQS